MAGARPYNRKHMEELENELRSCSLEIGYLQGQLSLRNVESNFMGELVHSLELKLAEVGALQERLSLLSEALMQSESSQLSLMQGIQDREEELHNSALKIEELETVISSIALESQCEIESMKLDVTALEEKCVEGERLIEQTAEEKAKMELQLEMSESCIHDLQKRVHSLETENKYLKQKLVATGDIVELKKEFLLLKGTSSSQEVYHPFDSNTAAETALDYNVNEKMSNQICELELQVSKLKEELRTEKLKAEEEGEDLTQAMAELRYQMTEMFEEECKRRSSIEETSLRRIQDLEEQLCKEKNNYLRAIRRLDEVHNQAGKRAVEIRHLNKAIEGYRQITDPKTSLAIESCIHEAYSYKFTTKDTLDDDAYKGDTEHQALIEWRPDGEDSPAETE